MLLSTEHKILIKTPKQEKGYGARKIATKFPNKIWTLTGLRYHNGFCRFRQVIKQNMALVHCGHPLFYINYAFVRNKYDILI